jgi:transposase
MAARQAAVRFGVGIATAIVWVRRARETGERTARLQGPPRRSKLDPHRDFLLGLIEAKDDISLVEMQERLAAERGIRASVGTIWTVLDRCNMTVKKRRLMRSSRTGLMC